MKYALAIALLLATNAQAADLAVPNRQVERRFGEWQINPIAYWKRQNKSSSSPRYPGNLTQKSKSKTK